MQVLASGELGQKTKRLLRDGRRAGPANPFEQESCPSRRRMPAWVLSEPGGHGSARQLEANAE